jgi:hypothetical protein
LSSFSEAVGFSSPLGVRTSDCASSSACLRWGVDLALQLVAGELVGDVLTHDQPAVALRIGEAGAELLCGLELLGGEARITGGVKGVAWRK